MGEGRVEGLEGSAFPELWVQESIRGSDLKALSVRNTSGLNLRMQETSNMQREGRGQMAQSVSALWFGATEVLDHVLCVEYLHNTRVFRLCVHAF